MLPFCCAGWVLDVTGSLSLVLNSSTEPLESDPPHQQDLTHLQWWALLLKCCLDGPQNPAVRRPHSTTTGVSFSMASRSQGPITAAGCLVDPCMHCWPLLSFCTDSTVHPSSSRHPNRMTIHHRTNRSSAPTKNNTTVSSYDSSPHRSACKYSNASFADLPRTKRSHLNSCIARRGVAAEATPKPIGFSRIST